MNSFTKVSVWAAGQRKHLNFNFWHFLKLTLFFFCIGKFEPQVKKQKWVQSTCHGSVFSLFAQPRQKIAAWHMESIWITDKRFWKSIFCVWFTQRSSSKEFNLKTCKENEKQFLEPEDCSHKWRQIKSRHNSNADICNNTVDYEFYNAGGITAELHGRTAKTANIGIAVRQIPYSTKLFLCWKIRFKNQVTTCSDLPSDTMLRINEVEMVDSLDELKSSRSVCGNDFPNFGMLSEQDHPEFPVWRRRSASRESRRPKKRTGVYEEDRSPSWSSTTFKWLVLVMQYWTTLIYSLLLFMMTTEFDTRWDEVVLSMSKIPSDEILESLYKLWIRESAQLKTVLELYDMEIDSSEDIGSQLSKVENNGEEEKSSETSITKLWR